MFAKIAARNHFFAGILESFTKQIFKIGPISDRPGKVWLGSSARRFATKNSQKMTFSGPIISRQNQAVEPSLRPLALALARPLTIRQPLLQAWSIAVDPQGTIPLCSLLCGHSPCHFISPFFARRRTFGVRGNPYVWGENSSMYDEHERRPATLTNTHQQV